MHNNQPLFTVATITYNSSHWVRQTIESILSSTFTDFELLISDDCSTDNTWAIVKEYSDVRIRSWRNDNNIGEYTNRNKVLNKASGKYILFVDGDDILYKQTLRNLSEYVNEFPEAASVWGVPSSSFYFALLPYLFLPEVTVKLIHDTKIHTAIIGFAETLFKIDCLKKIGGFSENYKIGDTWVKKRLAFEYPTLFVPMGFMLWRQSPTQASKKINSIYGGFLENYNIDLTILANESIQIDKEYKESLLLDIKSSFLKNLIRLTLLKFNITDFFKICKIAKIYFSDFNLIFRKRKMNYLPIENISEPLIMASKGNEKFTTKKHV